MNDGVGRELCAAEVSFVLINAENLDALSEPITATGRGHRGHPVDVAPTNQSN